MDRRHATGVALILTSAAGFGSGSLFAQPVYAAGVDWLVLSAWRFLFGAGLAWAFLLMSADRRRGLRDLDRRTVLVTLALGVLYVGNSGAYYASLETVSPGLAGLIETGRLGSGNPTGGNGYELDVVTAVVVGGASLAGGEGRVSGTLLGALLIGVLRNGSNLLGVDPFDQNIYIGLLIIVAVAFDQWARRRGG